MSYSDYYRPAIHQIRQIAQCSQCAREYEFFADQCLDNAKCQCGGLLCVIGESYPANADEWEEQRDPDGQWRERRW